MATLASIFIFPLKSGAPNSLDTAIVEPRGLAHDRRWMVVDASGKFLTGRQQPRLTLIAATPEKSALQLQAPGMPTLREPLPQANGVRIRTAVWGAAVTPLAASAEANAWISTFLGIACGLVYMDAACTRAVKDKYDGKYGEDSDEVSLADAFPLLLISQAALDLLNSKVGQPLPMLRFRPNLVVAGTEPHAEDRWKRIRIGTLEFDVVKPCTRCVFTTVDFAHGRFDPSGEPLRTLKTYRRSADGITFGQNLIPRSTGTLRVGDALHVLE
jgi:uncharacterized protein YcbX